MDSIFPVRSKFDSQFFDNIEDVFFVHEWDILISILSVLIINGGDDRIRTGVHGFAVRCVTTPPRRPFITIPILNNLIHCKNI